MDARHALPQRGLRFIFGAFFCLCFGHLGHGEAVDSPVLEATPTPQGPSDPRILPLPSTFLSYDLDLSLNPETRVLTGAEVITWTNPGQLPVTSIPLHLYLNAFAHEGTSWMESAAWRKGILKDNAENFDAPWGHIHIESLTLNGGEGQLPFEAIQPDDHNPLDETLVMVTLPAPIAPGETLTLHIDFESLLPIPVARTGGFDDFFLIAQFFPKISVRDVTPGAEGWVLHQFHGPTEFFADFADFEVQLTVPTGWVAEGSGRQVAAPVEGSGVRTYAFAQRGVHDVAYVAGSTLIAQERVVEPKGQDNPVLLKVLVPKGADPLASQGLDQLEVGLHELSQRVGPYPYDTLTMVMPPVRMRPAAGMEYPTFITGSAGDPGLMGYIGENLQFALGTAAHELGHQYFYGVVASNEFEEAYLDEGFTEYWGNEAAAAVTGPVGQRFERPSTTAVSDHYSVFRGREIEGRAIGQRPSWLLDRASGTRFYRRPEAILRTVAGRFGQDVLDDIFQQYYRRYAFKHPRLEDFLALAQEVGGEDVHALLVEGFARGDLPDYKVVEVSSRQIEAPDGAVLDVKGQEFQPLERWQGVQGGPGHPWRLVPGWRGDDGRGEDGAVTRPTLAIGQGEPPLPKEEDPDPGGGEETGTPSTALYRSYAEVRGGAWANLPVKLRFTFEDGTIAEDTWAGRDPYIQYTFVGESPLFRVDVDPESQIYLDADPRNNSLEADAEEGWGDDLGGLLGTAVTWVMMGVISWL